MRTFQNFEFVRFFARKRPEPIPMKHDIVVIQGRFGNCRPPYWDNMAKVSKADFDCLEVYFIRVRENYWMVFLRSGK